MGLSLSSLGMSPSGFTPGMGGLPIAGFTPGSSTGGGSTAAAMMMPSMSDLGLSSSSSKRGGAGGGDHERRRKMKVVLRKIGGRSGGVCEEGICRVSRRVGLANDVDAEGEEARREREGERAISIAGRDVLIDVDMKGNMAQGVVVAGMGGVGQEEMERAGRVLEGLLIDCGEGDLEGFGRELGRIASLDRVGERGVSAFEAVSGVGKSLKRLHERECEGEDDERRVLRKRSGRPWMHSRGRIGLGVDYWTTAPPKDDSAMDLDHQQQRVEEKEDPADFLTLHITAETCPAGMYPPVRISSNWLPEDLPSFNNNNKADSSNEPQDAEFQIPWQDPAPTYTTPPEDEQTSANDTQQQQNSKLPDIRFLAKLEPALILPLQAASQILAEMGGEGVQGMFREWHLLLADEAGITSGGEGAVAQVLGGNALVSGKDGEDVKHNYKLVFTKPEWGYRLSEVPFAHPRQVVGILPVLRQWGIFGGMVRSLLARSDVDVNVKGEGKVGKQKEQDDLLRSLLTPPSSQPEVGKVEEEGEGQGNSVRICVEVSTSPEPTLSISLPLDERQEGGGGGKMGRVVLSVGRNADVRCSLVEGFGDAGDDDGDGGKRVRERVARALEVCDGDLGVWGEWVRGGGWRRGKKSGGEEVQMGKEA